MFRIMLADDEGIVIDALKMIIQKNFGSSCQVEYAKTGRHVIELAERFRPDIAIMDIQMPGINGIDAMAEIQRFSPDTKFIVMSAYDKFDYAKKAIDLGVIEYLTKPANSSKIVQVLEKAMASVNKERTKRVNDLVTKEKLETVVPIIESGLIYSIIFPENDWQDTDKFKNLLGIEEDYGYILVAQYGDEIEEGYLTNPVGVTVKAQKFYNNFREIAKEFFNCIVGPAMGNRIVLFVPCEKPVIEYNERIANIDKARHMIRKLRSRIDVQFRIGMGSVESLEQINVSYREANNAMKNTKGSVFHIKDVAIGQEIEKDYPIQVERNLLSFLKRGNLSGMLAEANNFFDWMVDHYGSYQLDIKTKVLEMVIVAERESFNLGGMSYYFRDRRDYLQSILAIDGHQELRKWYIDKLSSACHHIMSHKNEQPVGIVDEAKNYILSNFHKDISLDEVSRLTKISPYYFSKVFKDETGQNFIEYLTSIRVERAKELLGNSKLSIKEICAQSGYSDPNYFSRLFKKCVGVTPTEYREGL